MVENRLSVVAIILALIDNFYHILDALDLHLTKTFDDEVSLRVILAKLERLL